MPAAASVKVTTRTSSKKVVLPFATSGATPLNSKQAVVLARSLSALADPVRIQIVSIVAAKGEICSCDLTTPLARSQPTISHHTTILAQAGILIGEKRGRWTWWRVAPESLAELRRALGEH